MKKYLVSIFVVLFPACFLFAEPIISFNGGLYFSNIESTHDNVSMKTVDIGLCLGGDFSYKTLNGFTAGANGNFIASVYGEKRGSTRIVTKGVGFNVAPEIGYSHIDKNLIQILVFPIIFQNLYIDDNDALISVGSNEVHGKVKTTSTDIKSGIQFYYGWRAGENSFTGISIGMNYNLYHKLKDDDNFFQHNGVQFIIGVKISALSF